MASALQVAKYILEGRGLMTTMKLQKLLYYCQAWSLAWDGEPLFDEEFEAWANGPVCKEVYSTHRGLFSLSSMIYDYVESADFTDEQIRTMNSVLDYYGDKDAHWLSELTHIERPWKETRGTCAPGEYCSEVIPKELMQEYYSGLV